MTAAAPSVRAWLADETRCAHEALHQHILFAPLVSKDLTETTYYRVLLAFLTVFQGIEQRRDVLNFFPEFSLHREIAALKKDLENEGGPGPLPTLSYISNQATLLGALYTALGSAFGGAVIARNIRTCLLSASTRYFGLPSCPNRWRALTSALEDHRADRQDLLVGSSETFALVNRIGEDFF